MAAFLISIPIVVTRSVVVIADDASSAAKRLVEVGAQITDRMPHVDAVIDYYSIEGGVKYGFELLCEGDSPEVSPNEVPKGTVFQ